MSGNSRNTVSTSVYKYTCVRVHACVYTTNYVHYEWASCTCRDDMCTSMLGVHYYKTLNSGSKEDRRWLARFYTGAQLREFEVGSLWCNHIVLAQNSLVLFAWSGLWEIAHALSVLTIPSVVIHVEWLGGRTMQARSYLKAYIHVHHRWVHTVVTVMNTCFSLNYCRISELVSGYEIHLTYANFPFSSSSSPI